MNKNSIKVIKRKDVEIIANAKIRSAEETKQTAFRSRREMVGTISDWISERRENNHLEKLAAIRQLFGSEPPLSEV